MRTILFILVAIALATPVAAQSENRWYLTGDQHSDPATGWLVYSPTDRGSGQRVDLLVDDAVEWVTEAPLAADAPGSGKFEYALTFESAGGTVLIEVFAYDPETNQRALVGSSGGGVTIIEDGPLGLGYGRASGSFEMTDVIPQGSHPMVALTVQGADKQLLTDEDSVVFGEGSSTTIPLPEISSIALVGLGLLTIAGVTRFRSTRA